jgi:hypothetical protein
MKINCLSCGHNVDLDESYEDHYEGAIKCYGCDATLEIKTEQGNLRGVYLCAPRERLERMIDGDLSGDHRGGDHRGDDRRGPRHNGVGLDGADKIQ